MSVLKIESMDDFQSIIKTQNLSVIHFSAEWAAQCGQVTDVLEELTKVPEIASNGVKFYVCDAEKLSDAALKYQVDSVPTVILFKNVTQIDRIDGANAAEITSKVKRHSTGTSAIGKTQTLEERLKELINKHNVMVFMKGNRDQPRCGFSKTLIQILNDLGVEYGTFDILADETVRQGLKTYSDWPTYPQVYVKGELIGGLDIVKELQASRELENILKA